MFQAVELPAGIADWAPAWPMWVEIHSCMVAALWGADGGKVVASYSETSVLELNSFWKAVREVICLKTESFFPLEIM